MKNTIFSTALGTILILTLSIGAYAQEFGVTGAMSTDGGFSQSTITDLSLDSILAPYNSAFQLAIGNKVSDLTDNTTPSLKFLKDVLKNRLLDDPFVMQAIISDKRNKLINQKYADLKAAVLENPSQKVAIRT